MDDRPPELGAPPWDPDQVLAWLSHLEEADAEEIRRLRNQAPRALLVGLHALLAQPWATRAVDVADRWREAGHTEDEAVVLLARLLAESELAEGWREWEDVADRAEVRLRLHALARAEAFDEALQSFLQRGSDALRPR